MSAWKWFSQSIILTCVQNLCCVCLVICCSYHVLRDEWSTCAGMNTSRSAAGAATLDGMIYVAGK